MRKVKLNDIAEVIMGQSPKSKFYNTDGNGLPFFQGRSEFGNIYPHVKKWCTRPLKIARKDDVLMTVRAPVGDLNIAREDCIIGRGLCALRSKLNNGRFLYYLLKKNNSYITSFGSGAVYDAINKEAIENLIFEIPDLLTQQKIASILSSYDDLIENNARRIQILEEMAQLIYQEWFVNFRFPGHEKVKFVNSELGKIPEGWKKPFCEFVDFKEGPGLRSHQYKEKGIPFLNIRTLVNNDIDFSKVKYLDEKEVYRQYRHFLLEVGDHVVSSSGTLGRIVTIQDFHLPLMLNTSIIRMRPKTKNVGRWQLKHFLRSNYFQNQIISLASGVAQMNYGPSHLKEMFIIAPTQEIGERYEKVVSPLELMIGNLVKKNKMLKQTRDLLLPKLISGEIDVSNLDIMVKSNE